VYGPGQTHLSIGCGSVSVRPVAGNPLRVPDRSCTGRRDGHRGSFGRTLHHNRSSPGKTLSCAVHSDQFHETPVLVDIFVLVQMLGYEARDLQQQRRECYRSSAPSTSTRAMQDSTLVLVDLVRPMQKRVGRRWKRGGVGEQPSPALQTRRQCWSTSSCSCRSLGRRLGIFSSTDESEKAMEARWGRSCVNNSLRKARSNR
jgi:hypothetical protein